MNKFQDLISCGKFKQQKRKKIWKEYENIIDVYCIISYLETLLNIFFCQEIKATYVIMLFTFSLLVIVAADMPAKAALQIYTERSLTNV